MRSGSPAVCLRGSASLRGAGGGIKIPLPAAQKLPANTFDVRRAIILKPEQGISYRFLRPRPRAEGAGPAPLVLFRPPGAFGLQAAGAKPAPCLPPALRQPCGLPPRLREPRRSRYATRGACTLRLRRCVCLPSGSASRQASASL